MHRSETFLLTVLTQSTTIVVLFTTTVLSLLSTTRKKLLAYCFTNIDQSFYVRELARIIEVDPTNLSRELKTLEEQRLFLSHRRGNQLYYQLNKDYPAFQEYKSIVQKAIGTASAVRKAMIVFPEIKTLILYGSFAKHSEDMYSDIDLLIVGDITMEDIADTLTKLERQLGREVNPVIYSLSEYRRKKKGNDPLLKSIFSSQFEVLIGGV